MGQLIGGSIIHEHIPYSITGCCRKQEKPDPAGVKESRHGRRRVMIDSNSQEDIKRAMVMRDSRIAISTMAIETC